MENALLQDVPPLENKAQMYLLAFLLCVVFTGCQTPEKEKKESTHSEFHQIPEEDARNISALLHLFAGTGAAYTFFGSKPASMECCANSLEFLSCSNHAFVHLVVKKGWESWQKHQSYFPNKNFLLKKISFKESGIDLDMYVFFNKKLVANEIEKNLTLFQTVGENQLSAKEILQRILEEDLFLHDTMANSTLLGTLLGYGRDNALRFEKRRRMINQFQSSFIPPFHPQSSWSQLSNSSKKMIELYGLKPKQFSPSPPIPINSLPYAELNDMMDNTVRFELKGSNDWLEKVMRPCFSVFSDGEETKELQARYEKDKQHIAELLQTHTFTEAVWEALFQKEGAYS